MKFLVITLVVFLSGCATDFDRRMYEARQRGQPNFGDDLQQAARNLNSLNQAPKSETCYVHDMGGGIYRKVCN